MGTGEGSYAPENITALTAGTFKLFTTTRVDPAVTTVTYTGYDQTQGYSVTRVKNALYLKK